MHRRFIGIVGLLPAALIVAGALAGCGGGGSTLTVGAAASLRSVLPPLAPGARMTFAGSDVLATQIREGASIDLLVSADRADARTLAASALVEAPVAIATNRLVIIVPAANRATITTPRDLARRGIRLVLAKESVPVGRYARRTLTSLGLAGATANVVSNEDSVTGVVAKVRLGEADAGIVYLTDARAAGADVRQISIPTAAQPQIVYAAAVVTASPHIKQARALIATLLGPDAQTRLRSAGFGPPPAG